MTRSLAVAAAGVDRGLKRIQRRLTDTDKPSTVQELQLYAGALGEWQGTIRLLKTNVETITSQTVEKDPKPRVSVVRTLSGELTLDDIIRKPVKELRPLPVATREDVFLEGASHVFAAHPKGGKSTLLEYLCYQWAINGHRI